MEENLTAEEIERMLEAAPAAAASDSDVEAWARSASDAAARNASARASAGGDPMRFVDSEVTLEVALQRLKAVPMRAGAMLALSRAGAPALLARLLSHENSDVAALAAALLLQFTDEDSLNEQDGERERRGQEQEEHGQGDGDGDDPLELEDALEKILLQAVEAPGFVDAIAARMRRLLAAAEAGGGGGGSSSRAATPSAAGGMGSEEADELFQMLAALLLRAVGAAPGAAVPRVEADARVLAPLAAVLRRERAAFSDAAAAVAELLAEMLGLSEAIGRAFAARHNGVDVLLEALAPYRRRAPATPSEEVYVSDLFLALASLLLDAGARAGFLGAEGFELMLILARARGFCRTPAMRVIGFALQDSPASCDHFVDAGGLSVLFGAFMSSTEEQCAADAAELRKKRARQHAPDDDERLLAPVLHALAALVLQVQTESTAARLMYKFIEGDCEKLRRLVAIHALFAFRVAVAKLSICRRREELADARADASEMDLAEGEFAAALQDTGLPQLRSVDIVLGVVLQRLPAVRRRVLSELAQRGATLDTVRSVVADFASETSAVPASLNSLLAFLNDAADAAAAPSAPSPAQPSTSPMDSAPSPAGDGRA